MKHQAIKNLVEGAQFAYYAEEDRIEWLNNDIPQPSDSAINTEVARLEAIASYQEPRSRAYPSIGDQLDMIFHAGLGGDEFQAAIQAVKDANPKT